MTEERESEVPRVSRDEAYWAARPDLAFVEAPADALNLNAAGRRVTGPVQGFGQLWQKTYWTALPGADISPTGLIALWKAEYASFWPRGSRFYGSLAGIKPGESALLNLGFGNATLLSTGILVMYADDESFTFMTPEGHGFAGWITFSAAEEDGVTVARITALIRASDPLYELGMPLAMHRMEDLTWERVLRALAARVGVPAASVHRTRVCVDRRRQWRRWSNIRQNSALRTLAYRAAHPFRR